MIRIDMIRQNTRHPDKSRRHPSQASCELAGQRFEAQGRGLVYKLSTLLWLHGRGGGEFEVWDDLLPFGNPGGLAITGRVRNWARLVNGKPTFERKTAPEPDFTPAEREIVARAAGTVAGLPQRVPSSGGLAAVCASRPLDGRGTPRREIAPLRLLLARDRYTTESRLSNSDFRFLGFSSAVPSGADSQDGGAVGPKVTRTGHSTG